MNKEDRNLDYLKEHVRIIWKIITDAEDYILEKYPGILLEGHPTADWRLPKEITFITSEELHQRFPDLDVHGRENAIVQEKGAVFIIGMGWNMADGSEPEEVRSPGYDDWSLNGDIMVKVRRFRFCMCFFVFEESNTADTFRLLVSSNSIHSLDTAMKLAAWAFASTGRLSWPNSRHAT